MWQSIVETAMGEECAAESDCQCKFTRIVMVRMQVAIAWNNSWAIFRAQKIYLVWNYMSGRTNQVEHNSQA